MEEDLGSEGVTKKGSVEIQDSSTPLLHGFIASFGLKRFGGDDRLHERLQARFGF